MIAPPPQPPLDWDSLAECPSLQELATFLRALPDAPLLAALGAARGRGRNDYPLAVLWGVVVLTIALRHASFEACLAELRRNPPLRQLIGIAHEAGVPKPWNLSRFLQLLGQPGHLDLLHQAFAEQVAQLATRCPTLGVHTAGDATHLAARHDRTGAPSSLPAPAGGRKEYRDAQGKVTKVIEWFGYKLHLLVDTTHEVALAYQVTAATADDGQTLPTLLDRAAAALPPGHLQTVAYDRAADQVAVHQALQERGVRPLVPTRALWQGEPHRPLPGHDQLPVQLTYTEPGTVYCWDRSGPTPLGRPMTYFGREAARGTLKYRCPALHGNFACGSERQCNLGKAYGLTVRVPQALDRRRFPSPPRASASFARLYRGRSAVERVNGRLKLYWGADDGNVTGAARFHAFIGTVLLVHLGMARLLADAPTRPRSLGATGLAAVHAVRHPPRRR